MKKDQIVSSGDRNCSDHPNALVFGKFGVPFRIQVKWPQKNPSSFGKSHRPLWWVEESNKLNNK